MIPSPTALIDDVDPANVQAAENQVSKFLSDKTLSMMKDANFKDGTRHRAFAVPMDGLKLSRDEQLFLAARCAQSGWHAEFEWSWKPELLIRPL